MLGGGEEVGGPVAEEVGVEIDKGDGGGWGVIEEGVF